MTSPALLLVIGGITLSLIIPAVLYKDKDFSAYLIGAASVLVVLTGITLLTSPLEYPAGNNVLETASGYEITPVSTPVSTPLNTAIGLILTLSGMAGVYTGFSMNRALKEDNYDGIEQLPGISDR